MAACGPPLRARALYAARASMALALNPVEGVERVRERAADRLARHQPRPAYMPVADWSVALQALLGTAWQPADLTTFWSIWMDATALLAAVGLATGRGSYGGWDDADPALARTLWCCARALRAQTVVETGVARGLTTRVALEALDRSGSGRLWSIDVPPLIERELATQVGAAVPARLEARWSLLVGSSRRRLPELVASVDGIDLFVHDSMHTDRNVRFELETVWPALRPGGVILVDDVDYSGAFARFTDGKPQSQAFVASHDDGRGLFGVVRKAA